MKRVLIVDAAEENLVFWRALFAGHDCSVDHAFDAGAALVAARQTPPELIVSDLLRTGPDRYALLRDWQADPRLRGIPFVVYTGTCVEADDERLVRGFGAAAVIRQPVQPAELLTRLREVWAEAVPPSGQRAAASGDNRPDLPADDAATLLRDLEEENRELGAANMALRREIAGSRVTREQLEQNAALLRIAGRAARLGGWTIDMPERKLHWSDETCFIHDAPSGYRPTLEQGLELFMPEYRAEVVRRIEACVRDGTPYEFEVPKRTLKGRLIWVRSIGEAVHDASGNLIRLQGAFQDITERKAADEALRESAQRFREMADNIGEIFYSYDPVARRLLYANSAYEEIWGRSIDSVYENPASYLDGVHPENRAAAREAFERQLAGRETNLDFRVIRPDGEIRWVHEHSVPVCDAGGQVERIVGTIRDITEKKLAEQRLAEQATLLDKAQDAILVRDLDHRILYWNQSAERLYGWTAEEVVGRSVKDLLYRVPTAFLAATETTLNQGEWVGELRQLTKEGKELVIEGHWTLVRDEEGLPRSVLSINTDITERKKIEQQFLRAQRMESIGTLAGGIAHDLNNVLAPILLSIELFRLEETSPERLKLLDHMENSARHGANLVKQVLSFTRGAEGHHVAISLRDLASDLQRIVHDTFPKNIVLQIDSASDLWSLKADATQLHQVLMNLCLNARDAMPPEGGQLTLGMRNVVLDDVFAGMVPDAKPGNYVVISLKDTGTGIPEAIRERIFDPFFTTKEVGKGTGLGLGTVQTIVKGHGGLIDVESEPGHGATFTIYLPASAGSPVETVAERPTEWAAGEGELLLVVDDEESIRAITRKLLEHCGYRVLLAVNGVEAVSLYREHGPEIAAVLTDMAMPVMDGPATIVALRSLNPAVKIVGSSGNTSDGGLNKVRGLGVQHFIRKPYTAEALLKVFAEVLQRTK